MDEGPLGKDGQGGDSFTGTRKQKGKRPYGLHKGGLLGSHRSGPEDPLATGIVTVSSTGYSKEVLLKKKKSFI